MTAKATLLSTFGKLPTPKAARKGEAFSAQAIERSSHQIAKDEEGKPAVLIAASDSEKRSSPYPVVLENISVRYSVLCEITDARGVAKQARFVVIKCESHEDELIEYFLRTIEVHIPSLGSAPSCGQVADMVEKLIELFRALSQLSKKSIQGLWAELLIIAESSDPRLLLRSWHATPDDRYDFALERQRIEVKSTSGSVRIHHFSLEQLNPPEGTEVLIASLFVERALDGLTVLDLMDKVRGAIRGDSSLLAHLHRSVTLTLASDWRQAASLMFDQRAAKKSLHIYDASSIPSVSWPVPLEVSEVKFKTNLSRTPTRDIPSLAMEGGLFATISQLAPTPVSV